MKFFNYIFYSNLKFIFISIGLILIISIFISIIKNKNKKFPKLTNITRKLKNPANFTLVILFIVIFGLLISYLIESITNSRLDSGWVGFWGNVVGGIVGGTVTLLGLHLTLQESRERERNRIKRFYGPFDNEIRWFTEILNGTAMDAKRYKTDQELIEKLRGYRSECIERFESALEYCKDELPIVHYHVKWYIKHVDKEIDSIILHISTSNSNSEMELYNYILEKRESALKTKKEFSELLESIV